MAEVTLEPGGPRRLSNAYQNWYRFSRNPMYVSLALLYIAVTLVLDSWWPLLLLPAVLAIVDRVVILREERYLSRAFPHLYDEYRRRVRRWL